MEANFISKQWRAKVVMWKSSKVHLGPNFAFMFIVNVY